MKQSDVANFIGCTVQSIRFWEHNRTKPVFKYTGKIIEFLGYDPFPAPQTLGERLKRYRLIHGLNQRELAKQMGVSHDSVIGWEKGMHQPTSRRVIEAIERVVGKLA